MLNDRTLVTATILSMSLLAGCATAPPPTATPNYAPPPDPVSPAIRRAPRGNLQLAEARQALAAYAGERVRWGGTVIAAEHDALGTRIEVQEHPLDQFGQPMRFKPSSGRYLVQADQSLDLDRYKQGREVTIAGTLRQGLLQSLAKPPTRLPVVEAREYMAWNNSEKPVFVRYRARPDYNRPCCAPRYRPYLNYGYPYFWNPYYSVGFSNRYSTLGYGVGFGFGH
jgi:outer membrane lipoprotein